MQGHMNVKLDSSVEMKSIKCESCGLALFACALCAVTNCNPDCLET